MNDDFEALVDRRDSGSVKWDRYAGTDILPMWVADMDFPAPPAVLTALRRHLDHGVLGYTHPRPTLVDAVVGHLEREYRWAVDPDWIVWLPGLVTGLNVACRAVDGAVATATPVYPPFLSAPRLMGRALTTVPLLCRDRRWQWDWPALDAALGGQTRLFLLCHPHNPVGRAWDEAELLRLAELAERHDLVVCSDEIHCGLLLDPERRHRPFAALPAAARRTITLMAPSKTFNIPGLGCAWAVIADPVLRQAFRRAMDGIVPHVNALGLVACEAALRGGGDWRAALLATLRRNRERLVAAIAGWPGFSCAGIEATYLAWIDGRDSGIADLPGFFEAAGVGVSAGRDFGVDNRYAGYVRLNFGCPPTLLDQAVTRIEAALERR